MSNFVQAPQTSSQSQSQENDTDDEDDEEFYCAGTSSLDLTANPLETEEYEEEEEESSDEETDENDGQSAQDLIDKVLSKLLILSL